ncbi:hypothetical protein D9619_013238 [Psilocybe cf. subviscida]|uniref:FAD dependent oxidoreductase domain-containing protein n=1 Tax=Psilocybe cf. subviscida TaxID=2480587 RepID=A0A8H5BS99_9AGAR|nr:hypothetical protein D9619_013238 [Psilocybe cf. subviscida]
MPSATSTSSPFVSLRFIVVGGGISGLATATTLRKAGHEVLVLEKGGGKIKVGCTTPPSRASHVPSGN